MIMITHQNQISTNTQTKIKIKKTNYNQPSSKLKSCPKLRRDHFHPRKI